MKWPSWLKLRRRSEPQPPASPTACPKCSREMKFVEKFTMLGDDIRTYRCSECGLEYDLDFGIALWKLMSDVNKMDSGE